jgi:hypothetical protein
MIASALDERMWTLPQRGVCIKLHFTIAVVGVRQASVGKTRGGRWGVFGWEIPLRPKTVIGVVAVVYRGLELLMRRKSMSNLERRLCREIV